MGFLKGIAASLIFCSWSSTLFAGDLEFDAVKATPTFALAKMGAVYGTFKNVSDTQLEISNLQVSEDIADGVELHESYIKNDMASMKQLNLPYSLESQEQLVLRKGGKHIMLIGLKQPLESGMQFDLTISVTGQQDIIVPVVVGEEQQKENAGHQHHHH